MDLRDLNLSEKLLTDQELTINTAITMARQTEALREQQAVVRGKTDNTFTRIEALQHSYSNNKKLRTVFQVSKIPKQSTRKVALHVAVSNTS